MEGGVEGRARLPPMCSREARDREMSLISAEHMVMSWLDTLSKPCKPKNNGHCVPLDTDDITASQQSMAPALSVYLPDILRLTTNCPFADVRERCTKLLALVSVSNNFSLARNVTASLETTIQLNMACCYSCR